MEKEIKNTFYKEWKEMLKELKEKNKEISEMDYFFRLAKREADVEYMKERHAKIILLGTGLPQEILMAVDGLAVYLAGGSFVSAGWADQMVPRDTDSVIKSTLGILTQEEWELAKDALVIIPVSCDSMRKLSYMLSQKMKVLTIELPSDKEDEIQLKHWKEEIHRAVHVIEKHTHRRISHKKLTRQCKLMNETKELWKRISETDHAVLSGSTKMFLANSWFWAEDKKEWLKHLKKLEKKITTKEMEGAEETNPQVLLLGSPIYAPNYKVPFLLEELHMDLADMVHPMTELLSADSIEMKGFASKTVHIDQLAEQSIQKDISTAYVKNTGMVEAVREKIRNHKYDGVVVHILKGQIEYDFELNVLEPLFEKNNLPVFRLETDYNYQDIEQLRIRLEAFSEMMHHRASLLKKGA